MKIHYGISVASASQLRELPVLKKADFLEVSSVLRNQPDFIIPAAWKKRFYRASWRHEAKTLNSLVDVGSGIKLDFYRMFSAGCAEIHRLGVSQISLLLDWENVFSDVHYAAKMQEILRCCFGIAEKSHLQTSFELRIPGSVSFEPEQFIKFRNSLLYPVRTVIDLHPHEPGALELLEKYSDALRFDCSCFRISFDADRGNYLTVRLLDKVRQSIRKVGCEVPQICFYPGRNADKETFAQLESVIL